MLMFPINGNALYYQIINGAYCLGQEIIQSDNSVNQRGMQSVTLISNFLLIFSNNFSELIK